ncbi:endonuclease domain-containing protein [Ulvibacter antarcticus]|uniref:Very-short-patch-repair endonuclease n=1 Tax=Ulvibacter antarcticus TaxID=442714 RepID=A0A3L9YYK7_9FLAO|nr:DUF559 domain-containing protein [Ulvibacter antarcticus]RMA65811.1 very-short-patch-repair endonuclease [Ulvibacter antarcticus]
MANKIIPYRKDLKLRAQYLRNNPTETEIVLWNEIRKSSLRVEFHRQVPILDYIVDFYCHEIGLVIEIDGSVHDSQVLEDGKRQGRIEEYGVRLLRFSNKEIFTNLPGVLKTIKEYVDESIS